MTSPEVHNEYTVVDRLELFRLREIEEAAKELFFFDREHDRILDCDWPENEHPWVDDFLDALADASNEARAELERLVGEGGKGDSVKDPSGVCSQNTMQDM